MFCKYKDVLGKPRQVVHKYRIFNIAIVDVIFTVLAAYLINKSFPNYKFIYILLVLFLLGIVMHRIFCVETTIDQLLFS